MKILSAVFLLPIAALASPPPGTINLAGSCTISSATGSKTVPLFAAFRSRAFVLGYKGDDGGDYEINIVNNGGSGFEKVHGAIVIGFARANSEIRNPPLLCPTVPDEARRECEERNQRENPPFVPYPSDKFTYLPNKTGDVKYEVLMGEGGPDKFTVTRFGVPSEQIRENDDLKIQTPRAALGGVLASCSLSASRN